jgi:FixJ family two-component response regulator
MSERPFITIIDDDVSLRESLPDLLRQLGFAVTAFSSAEEFLISGVMNTTQCLILDVAMPGMSGPALQQELTQRGLRIPIVFITADADPAVRHRLVRLGAVECLIKPFSDASLLAALNVALRPA